MRIRCVLVAAALIVMVIPVQSGAVRIDDVREDAEWIMSARLADGAIANYVDRQAVWPYLANFAAMGLARATEVTKDARYVNASWRWLRWYQAHMDSRGYVTDYVVRDGAVVSTGFMDSTDAYAGTFLMAVRDTYLANKSLTKLKGLRTGISLAVKAIESTQTSDGLTWAKPSWKVKYLMDQAEVYAGFRAAADLAGALRDPTLSKRAATGASRVYNGVQSLWTEDRASYDWAKHEDGGRTPNTWSNLYPDAMQQVWAVAFGTTSDARAARLMTAFVAEQPTWAMPGAMATFSGSSEEVGYWPIAGLALQRTGDRVAAEAGAASIRSTANSRGRQWPYTTATAGQLILLESYDAAGARTLDGRTAVISSTSLSPKIGQMAPAPTAGGGRSTAQVPSSTSDPAPSAPPPEPTPIAHVDVGPLDVTLGDGGVSISTPAPSERDSQ